MALRVSQIPKAVAEVMAGISAGLEEARNTVDVVRPPPKVVFSGDMVIVLNSLERIQTEVREPTVRVTDFGPKVSVDVVERDGVYSHTDTTTRMPHTRTEEDSGGTVTKRSFEDQAVGIVLEYPGPTPK
jgi:ribosome-interacting GTPase 1